MTDLRRYLHWWDDLNPIYAAGAAALAVVAFTVGITNSRKSRPAMTLSVRWGREKLRIPLPSPTTKLGALRSILSEQTGLPYDSFKLVHAGAVMKDDNAPLSAFGLRSGSKIAIIDGAANAHTGGPSPTEKKNKTKPETEEATVTVIRDELARVQENLLPALDIFLQTIAPPQPSQTSSAPDATPADNPLSSTESQSSPQAQPTSTTTTTASVPKPPPPGALPDIEMEHNRLGEEFLQSLLRLDVLTMERSWDSARAERKVAVKQIQGLLDRLDDGWRERKGRLAS